MIPVNLKFCLNGLFFVKVNINVKQLIVLCGTRIIKLFVTGDNTNLVDAQYAIWDKVFKNGPTKIFARQPLKKFEGVWSIFRYENVKIKKNNQKNEKTPQQNLKTFMNVNSKTKFCFQALCKPQKF